MPNAKPPEVYSCVRVPNSKLSTAIARGPANKVDPNCGPDRKVIAVIAEVIDADLAQQLADYLNDETEKNAKAGVVPSCGEPGCNIQRNLNAICNLNIRAIFNNQTPKDEAPVPNPPLSSDFIDRLTRWSDSIHIDDKSDRLLITLTTKLQTYSISMHYPRPGKPNGYMGCVTSARTPEPGENWKRGNDLCDGPYSEETWNRIMTDIVAYEIKAAIPSKIETILCEPANEVDLKKETVKSDPRPTVTTLAGFPVQIPTLNNLNTGIRLTWAPLKPGLCEPMEAYLVRSP